MNSRVTNPRRYPGVTLCVGSGSYIGGLEKALHSAGLLTRAIRLIPKLEVIEPRAGALESVESFPVSNFLNRLLWAVWRRLPFRAHSHVPILATSRIADRIISNRIQPASIFHGVTGNAIHSLAVSRRRGIMTVLEHPMVHPRFWQRELLAECQHVGLPPERCETILPESLIRRREREYRLSDKIIVPSRFAANTFSEQGLSNTEVILPGVDQELFRPSESLPTLPFRVGYVGRLELGKGVLYLLQAWKKLSLKNAELVLMGTVRPEIGSALRELQASGIKVLGFLSRENVAQELRQCSLFVFPSLHEGLAQTVLEAMASGVTVVATPNSGADDCLTHGKEGFIVPARSDHALAETISWAAQNRGAVARMGQAARARMEAEFTLNHYHDRMVAFYRRLGTAATAHAKKRAL